LSGRVPSSVVIVALISLDGVSRTYQGAVPVRALLATTLAIEQGEYVSISGASGSGKSTLMNVLGLLDRPGTGSYAIGGLETTVLGERDRTTLRASCFGFVFQAF
jgi:putative ABC transport system ATP-binding protein